MLSSFNEKYHLKTVIMFSLFMVFAGLAGFLCQNGDCNNCRGRNISELFHAINENCPAGYYLVCTMEKNNYCNQCGDEEYTNVNNLFPHCAACSRCSSDTEIIKSECTTKKNRVCGCKNGFYFNQSSPMPPCKSCKYCSNCSKCPTCTNCSSCKNDQFKDQNGNCQSCLEIQCQNEYCHSYCKRVHPLKWTWPVVVVIILTLVLLFVLHLLLYFKACNKGQFYCWGQKKENIIVEPSVAPLNPQNIPAVYSNDVTRENLSSAVLYAIIKQVPVRRWKEFLRLLSVSDDQMERVEMDERLYSEQQYLMLRLWSQRSDANLETIYSTLQHMDLSGCVEELQEKIQQLQKIHVV